MTTLTLSGGDLHQAAAWATRATPSKAVVPLLSCLLLDARPDTDEVVLTGYDFEVRASATVAAAVAEPGRIVVSARLLAAVAKTLGRTAEVHISDDRGAAQIRCGRSEWTLPTLAVEDYPQLPAPPDPVGTVDAEDLRRALGQVLPALGRDDTLPMLTAVRLESDGDELTLAGTDRFRLASTTIPWAPARRLDDPLAVNLPGPMLDTAVRGVADTAGPVALALDDARFAVSTTSHLVVGRQLAVEYPPWRRLVAQANPSHHAVVDVGELLRAVEQAMVAANERPQVLLEFAGDAVEVSAQGTDRAARAVASARLVGGAMTIAVSAVYLRDAVAEHGTDTVTISFGSTPTRPVGIAAEGARYIHTLMPVRAGAS